MANRRPLLLAALTAVLVGCGVTPSPLPAPLPTTPPASTAPTTPSDTPTPSVTTPAASWDTQLAQLKVPCTKTLSADGLVVQTCQSERSAASHNLPVLTAYVLTSARGVESFALLATPWYDTASAAGRAAKASYEAWRKQVWTVLGEQLVPEADRLGFANLTGMRRTAWGLFGRNPALSSWVGGGVWFAQRADAAVVPQAMSLNSDPSALTDHLSRAKLISGGCQLPLGCTVKLGSGVNASIGLGGETSWYTQLTVHQTPEPSHAAGSGPALAIAATSAFNAYLPAVSRPRMPALAAELVVNRYGVDRRVAGAVEVSAGIGTVAYTCVSEYFHPRLTPGAREWATMDAFRAAYTDTSLSREQWNAKIAGFLASNATVKPAALHRLSGEFSPVMVTAMKIVEGEPAWTIRFSVGGDQEVTAVLVGDKLLSLTEA